MDAEAAIALAASLAQLGVAAAALKVAMELKAAVLALKEQFGNHEKRITELEDK
jgi:hypothetical protein